MIRLWMSEDERLLFRDSLMLSMRACALARGLTTETWKSQPTIKGLGYDDEATETKEADEG